MLVMALEPALVAAQTLFDAFRRLIEGGVGLLRAAVGLKHDAGGEMQAAIGAKARALRRDRDMAADSAVEIFRRRRLQPLRHMSAKRFADVDVLAGNPQRHFASGLSLRAKFRPRKGQPRACAPPSDQPPNAPHPP